jgi:hypothetical protein
MKKINWVLVSMVVVAMLLTAIPLLRVAWGSQPASPAITEALNPQPEPPGIIVIEPEPVSCPGNPTTAFEFDKFEFEKSNLAATLVDARFPGEIICLHD